MDEQENRDKLYDYAKNSKTFSKLSMSENADLVMFYCISFLKDNVYHFKSLDLIAIATINGNQLHLWDVFGNTDVDLDTILYSIADSKIDEVVLGFTPLDCSSYGVREISGKDILYIQKNKAELFSANKLMFSLLSHA